MDSIDNQMNVIDLISETHTRLRAQVRERWEKSGNEFISQSESHLLARVAREALSISEAARQTGVSRQAAQKTASKLIDKGYLCFRQLDENRRDKFMYLTSRGREFIDLSEQMKRKMEEELMERIGGDEIRALKSLLVSL